MHCNLRFTETIGCKVDTGSAIRMGLFGGSTPENDYSRYQTMINNMIFYHILTFKQPKLKLIADADISQPFLINAPSHNKLKSQFITSSTHIALR